MFDITKPTELRKGQGWQSGIVTEHKNKHSQIMPDQIPEGLAFCVFKMPYYNIIYINIMDYEYL